MPSNAVATPTKRSDLHSEQSKLPIEFWCKNVDLGVCDAEQCRSYAEQEK